MAIAAQTASAKTVAKPRVIEARGLVKYYGEQAVVDGIDLDVQAGECFGLLGPNGAGKTTTLRMLLGNVPPNAGQLQVLGHPIPQQARQMRARVGVVPQQDNLDPDFTVTENLRVYASYFGLAGPELDARISELLSFATLETKAQARIGTLSGGMKRRLTLARALINQPDLLILDEPSTGLDPQARQLIWQRLRALLAQGKTLILTTHYMEEAERVCDRVAIMDHGHILALGSPSELTKQHIEPHVLEVYGPGFDSWHEAFAQRLALRTERVGETVFCYARDESALLENLRGRPELRFVHRPGNLEDVFLKLTGRELRD
ncbi:MAG TPA: ATP-binding cassette domain-containing protein [Gammaproteobacteria bacterium]|nr:ATP-binding cassette domain-containing protein [Gammaproteobacteria bacterium]